MNAIYLSSQDQISEDIFHIQNDERSTHLNEVLRIDHSKRLKVVVLDRGIFLADISRGGPHFFTCQLISALEWDTPWFNLQVGASRPPTCKKIIEHACAMGLKKLTFFQTSLSEKSYLSSKIFEPASLEHLALLGLSQGARYCHRPIMTTNFNSSFPAFEEGQHFFLSLQTEKNLHDYQVDFSHPLTLVIGPERGWSQQEEERARKLGHLPIKISPSILRVENALIHTLGVLEFLKMKTTA